ncbi:MAG: roadblock/LC7 domain-containing protein [Gemmatimonadaceae bacterium]|nr:roadblock/LC7 domain-containing protein [Gemmatimonadaceae bacterium]MDQ3518112.1 roadblock/LC7 domain-containing protein [Gemmatimonadota bacterium]
MAVSASSWSFTEDDFAAISRSLERFLSDSNARCALIVDRSGQLVATVGEQPRFDAVAFATLTAADFSANDQLARLIGETEFRSLVHRGEQESIFLADIGRRVILVVLFDIRTTEGMVRLKAKGIIEELERTFAALFERGRDARAKTPGILAGADDEIDRLFQ